VRSLAADAVKLARYIVRRLLLLVPVLLGVSILTFVLVRVLPGNPVRTVMPPTATPADVAVARHRFGLDRPVIAQYWIWLKDLLHGRLGNSFQTGVDIRTEFLHRIGPTFELVTLALLLALVVAIPFGLLAAFRAGRASDHVIRIGALSGGAVSEFWLGLLLILFFYNDLHLAPAPNGRLGPDTSLHRITSMELVDSVITGNGRALSSAAAHAVLPVVTLALVSCAPLVRGVRASALQVLASDAFRCAESHGLARRVLLLRYTLRGAVVGIPTLAALIYGNLLGGAVLVEYVFSWQGFGQWALNGLLLRDYPVIQAFVLVSAGFYVVVFLVADLIHAMLDPRVKL
jgi:peptide/nickel transport system permease protein